MKIENYKQASILKEAVKSFHLKQINLAVEQYGLAGLSRLLSHAGIKKCSSDKIYATLSRKSFSNVERLSIDINEALRSVSTNQP